MKFPWSKPPLNEIEKLGVVDDTYGIDHLGKEPLSFIDTVKSAQQHAPNYAQFVGGYPLREDTAPSALFEALEQTRYAPPFKRIMREIANQIAEKDRRIAELEARLEEPVTIDVEIGGQTRPITVSRDTKTLRIPSLGPGNAVFYGTLEVIPF